MAPRQSGAHSPDTFGFSTGKARNFYKEDINMQITDPVADMLTRIRNANSAKHETVDVPASNLKKAIAQILLDEGYIKSFSLQDNGNQGVIHITLKYLGKKQPALSGLKRVSSPACVSTPAPTSCPRFSQGPGHRHRFHFQGRYDRQEGSRKPHRRRSPGIRLVRRVS